MLARSASLRRHILRHREFADAGTERTEFLAHRDGRVVMAQHRDAGRARRLRQAQPCRRHLRAPRPGLFGQRDEDGGRDAAAAGVFRHLLRIAEALHDPWRVVIIGQQLHAAGGDIRQHFLQRVEIVGLEPAMDAEIDARRLARFRHRRQGLPPGLDAAQPRLPGQGHAEKGGGDPGRQKLRRRVADREARRYRDARPRLHLALMRVAMDVDERGQHQQPRRVKSTRIGRCLRRDAGVRQRDIGPA